MDKKSSLREMPLSFQHGDAEPVVSPTGPAEFSVKEAKAKLTELLRRVEAGERITLTRHGKPVADLVPHDPEEEERKLSFWERYQAWCAQTPLPDIGWVSPDFDDPLPEDFLLQPFPDDFDEKLAEHDRRVEEARRRMNERGE